MKEAKRLRRTKRQQKKANFFNTLAFKIRAFAGVPEPKWSRFYKDDGNHKPSVDPTMSNKERLAFNRMDNGKVGKKRHGRFTVTKTNSNA